MRSVLYTHRFSIIAIGLIAAWTALLFWVTPDKIVQYVGVENTYLVSFLIAAFGGLSFIGSAPFFASITTFAAGGAHPALLALCGGMGVFISDTAFFLLARRAISEFKGSAKPLTQWILRKIRDLPPWALLLFVYIYVGFLPLPNDALMVALAFTGLSYLRLVPVLLAGSFTIVYLAASIGQRWL